MAKKESAEKAVAPEAPAVTEQELEAIFSGPAVLANKVYFSSMANGVRLTFMEQRSQTEPPIFRTAAFLSVQDAIALLKLMQDRLKGIEEQLQAAVEEARKDDVK